MSTIWMASRGVPFAASQTEEVVGGVAIALGGRIGEAALLAQPLLKDRELSMMRMVLTFGFIEPTQEAQPLNAATDKACSRLG